MTGTATLPIIEVKNIEGFVCADFTLKNFSEQEREIAQTLLHLGAGQRKSPPEILRLVTRFHNANGLRDFLKLRAKGKVEIR